MTKRIVACVFIGLLYAVTILLLVFAISVSAHAQSAPNCNQQNAILSAAGTGPNYNATSVKCVAWTFSYYAEGFSALSIQVESAPDVNGAPGAFTLVPGVTGNPSTGTVSGSFSFSSYFPWLRVNLTSATGTGFVNYTLIGNSYIAPSNSSGGGGGGTTSTVNGPDAPGAAPTKNPVQDSGVDGGGLVRRFLTDTTGAESIIGETAAGLATSVPPVIIGGQSTSGGTSRYFQNDFNAGSGNGSMVVSFIQGALPSDAFANVIANFRSANNSNSSIPLYVNDVGGFDGTNWDRYRTASLANFPTTVTLIARNTIGARLAEKGSRWSVVSNPAAGSQATASIAAEASVRHVVDCVSFAAAAITAPVSTLLTVNVRDGASGAGTVIWTWQVEIPAAANAQEVAPHSICGLNLVGTTNTAMTAEFSALLANLAESVSISGYNVN